MKEFAIVALLLLLSACIQTQPQTQTSGNQGNLGMGDDSGTGLDELPEDTTSDDSLVGEPLDLGPLV